MDLSRLTQKSQEALHQAQSLAVRHGHQMVDVEHLLTALLGQEEGLLPRLFSKMDVPVEPFAAAVERELQGRPQVGGPGAEPGKVYLSQRLSELLVRAEDEARQMKDEYVSVEHIVLAMIDEGAAGPAARIFREFRVTQRPVPGGL